MRNLVMTALAMIMLIPSVEALETTTLTGANGVTYQAYVAGPINAKAGVLIVHDWFGVTEFTKQSVERLGLDGIRALAIDLYAGKSARTHDEATVLSKALDGDHAQIGVLAGLEALQAGERPVALAGYSMGGRIVLRAGSEHPELVKAVALIYAGGFDGIDDRILKSVGPVLAVTGAADEWSYVEHAGLEKRMRKLGRQIEVYIYPNADHAFAQKLYNDGKNFDLAATNAMHNVLDDFLSRQLGLGTK